MSDSNAVETTGLEKVESALEGLTRQLKEGRLGHERLRWFNRGVTLAVLLVFVLYMFLFYDLFTTNLSAENFSRSFESSMGQMAPLITDASLEVLTQVSPVYLELTGKKVDAMLPVYMAHLEKQTDVFVMNMSKFAETEFQNLLERIVTKVADDFRKKYPDLTDEEIHRFVNETEDELTNLFADLSNHILDRSIPPVMEMKLLTEKLLDKDMPQDEMELYRLFLHKLLLLLDHELMEG